MTDPETLRRREAALEVYVAKQHRLAREAAEFPDRVREQLAEAEEFFANGDHANATLLEVAQAGERVARHARRLVAARRLNEAEHKLAVLRAERA